MEFMRETAQWVAGWADTPYGAYALFIIAFMESSFFPIPPDVLLIALALVNPPLALIYAAICTIGSVLGGGFGYVIGDKGGKPVLRKLFSEQKITFVENYYKKYDVWAVAIAGFTPIPYKVFTIAAGAFSLEIKRFFAASAIGRGGRFFLVGILFMLFGEQAKTLLGRHFEIITLAFVALLIGGFSIISLLSKRASRTTPADISGVVDQETEAGS